MEEPKLQLTWVLANYWPILVASFAMSVIMTPICRKIAYSKGIVDRPDDFLKPHHKPIPYLGGVAIFLGWAAGLVLAFLCFDHSTQAVNVATDGPVIRTTTVLGIGLAGLLIMLIGLFDDLRVMSPKVKLAGNILVAVILMSFGVGHDIIEVFADRMQVGFQPQEWWLRLLYSAPITIFIVVGACNATNLIDGVDGLCSGVLGIISAGFLVLAIHLQVWRGWNAGDTERVVLSLAMLGAAVGFLPYNRNPATIFMGDAGSMLLGFNVAVLLLLFTQGLHFRWAIASLLVFGLPVADMVLTLVRRWRHQRPLMIGDRSHFYDQLLDRGLSVKKVVLISYVLAAGFVLLGLSLIVMRTRHAILIFALAFFLIIWLVHKMKMVRVEQYDSMRRTQIRTQTETPTQTQTPRADDHASSVKPTS